MAKNLNVLLKDFEGLKTILGDNPWEFNLQAYFLRSDFSDRDALYIPKCLVGIEAFAKEDDYFLAEHPEVLFDENYFNPHGLTCIEDADYSLERELVLPTGVKKVFDRVTFDYHYTTLAMQLLFHVRKEIRKGV